MVEVIQYCIRRDLFDEQGLLVITFIKEGGEEFHFQLGSELAAEFAQQLLYEAEASNGNN